MQKKWILLLAILSITARFTISLEAPFTKISEMAPLLVIFTPILPIVLSVFHTSRNNLKANFISLIKSGMKGGLSVTLLYIIALFVLFQWVHPFEFEARKELIITEQIAQASEQENFDEAKFQENIGSAFTSFNYITLTLVAMMLLSLLYSLFASLFARLYSKRYAHLNQEK